MPNYGVPAAAIVMVLLAFAGTSCAGIDVGTCAAGGKIEGGNSRADCPTQMASGSVFTASASAASTVPQPGQQNTTTRILTHEDLHVIFTIDPNFHWCFESIPINNLTRRTVFAYVRTLKDALTATVDNPDGDDLLIAPDHVEDDEYTYRMRIDAALAAANYGRSPGSIMLPSMLLTAYQMTQLSDSSPSDETIDSPSGRLPSDNLHFTTSKSFWKVAEITNEEGFLSNVAIDPVAMQWVSYKINSIKGAVIFLPRWTPLVHTTEPDATAVTTKFGSPPQNWGPSTLLHMVSTFARIAQVSTVPDLPEWAANANKTQLQVIYSNYYNAAPEMRTPPLETATLTPPMTPEEAKQQCWKDKDAALPSESTIQNTMKAIFEGLQQLHALAPPGSSGRLIAEKPDEAAGGTAYILKRDFAEAAYGMTKFRFPDHLIQAPHAFMPWLTKNEAATQTSSGQKESAPAPQLLRDAALHVINAACGLPWLLQFKVALFEMSEYRVYMLNGAKSRDEDMHVVYTPAVFRKGRLEMSFETLKPGSFLNVLLPLCYQNCRSGDANDAASELPPTQRDALSNKQEHEWKMQMLPSPKIYNLLLSSARDGAKALRVRRTVDGSPLHSTNDVFIRVDVLLAMPWNESSGRREVVPRINEMDWLNSAALIMGLWDKSPEANRLVVKPSPSCANSNSTSTDQSAHETLAMLIDTASRVVSGNASEAATHAEDSSVAGSSLKDTAGSTENSSQTCHIDADTQNSAYASSSYPHDDSLAKPASSPEPCGRSLERDATADELRVAMQKAQGASPAFVLARAMLHRAAKSVPTAEAK